MRNTEKGVVRPLWLMLGVFTCVIFGSTLNRCLTCGQPRQDEARAQGTPVVQGELLNAPAKKEPEPEPVVDEEQPEGPKYLSITFDKLASYQYVYPDIEAGAELMDQIPESIQQLDGEPIAIQGFMIPVKVEGERVTEFLLVRNQLACCFGVVPKMNEWLHIRMAPGKTSAYAVDLPITVYGTLDVGELIEEGVVMSLYRLEGDEVVEPPVFR